MRVSDGSYFGFISRKVVRCIYHKYSGAEYYHKILRQRRKAGILTAESVKYFCGETPGNESRFEKQLGRDGKMSLTTEKYRGEKRMKLLILGDEETAIYHPLSGVSGEVVKVLRGMGECVVSAGYRRMMLEELKKYDVVISYIDNYTDEGGFGDKLAAYIEEGGRVLALHNGIITPAESRLERAYGGNFITHPPYRELWYYLGDELFGVMEEEPYMVRQTDENNEIFLWFEMDGKKYPAGWYRNSGMGKVCYLSPGHDGRTAGKKEFQELLRIAVKRLAE